MSNEIMVAEMYEMRHEAVVAMLASRAKNAIWKKTRHRLAGVIGTAEVGRNESGAEIERESGVLAGGGRRNIILFKVDFEYVELEPHQRHLIGSDQITKLAAVL
jgi:hypothetical protein